MSSRNSYFFAATMSRISRADQLEALSFLDFRDGPAASAKVPPLRFRSCEAPAKASLAAGILGGGTAALAATALTKKTLVITLQIQLH
jgi:hypothetical protein